MKTNLKRVPTKFGPDTRFELKPAPPAPFQADRDTVFELLKRQVLLERLADSAPEFNSHLRWAANDAAALAWGTAYPLLVFPALFEEKAKDALARARKQEDVRQRSLELLPI